MTNRRNIVLIGASMGGIQALSVLVGQLSASFPAAVFVVQHIAADSPRALGGILGRRGPLPAVLGEDGMHVRTGQICIAPPNRHMLVSKNGIRVVFGPRENLSRPAIDPLFRTAAVHYRSRAIGVILTGHLGDGAAGLHAIKRCGGVAVVQAPEDAAYPEMPRHALAAVDVDYTVPLEEMGSLLVRLTAGAAPEPPAVPEDLLLEARLTEQSMRDADWWEVPSRETPFTCPECGGRLQEIQGEEVKRNRCYVGHAFTGEAVLECQDEDIEEALWVAVRTLEERARMLEALARNEEEHGRHTVSGIYTERAAESRTQEALIRRLLSRLSDGGPITKA